MQTLARHSLPESGVSPRTLIDDLLEEQHDLSAVERFSTRHDVAEEPLQARYYRDLIPLSLPQPGEQYAFEVNLDSCTGCKACVSACHSLNGLDEGESWRQVGLLHSDSSDEPFQQIVTAACHHCAEPACMHGCPVMAYDKNSTTGIVRHLDDQCIGCQYCVLKCPYDVPKYHAKKGIVRKCDMCQNRLGVGEAPACVQACPTQAIRITVIRLEDIRDATQPGKRMISGTFDSSYTSPTTRYVTAKPRPENLVSADASELRLEPAHYPLVFMLVLTQFAVGLFGASVITTDKGMAALAMIAALLGVGASTLHLGRPLGAWRAFLGLRRSWLSREIVVFGGFLPVAMIYTALLFSLNVAIPWRGELTFAFGVLGVILGLIGVFCSAMIYIDTRREFWSATITVWKFFGTTLILGASAAALFSSAPIWVALIMVSVPAKLAGEASLFRHLRNGKSMSLHRTARVMSEKLGPLVTARFVLALLGMSLLMVESLPVRAAAILALFTGEILERVVFFRAVSAPRMPGGFVSGPGPQ